MINVNCKQCGEEFKIKLCRKDTAKFCSQTCSSFSRNEKIKKFCLFCKKEFKTVLSQVKRGKGKFCSLKCFYISRNRRIKKLCLICKKEFAVRLYRIKDGEGKYCSRKCQGKWRSINIRGENHWSWKGGTYGTERHAIMRQIEYINWAKNIKERDNYTCQICGITKAFFHSNHIKKFADYPELRFNLINGITICRDCDHKFVMRHEELCEDFFNFNLIERGYL